MEETQALVDRAEKLGLKLQYVDGFIVARKPAMPDEAVSTFAESVIRGLAAQLKEVGRLLVARCRNARGQQLLGRQALAIEMDVVGSIVGCGDTVNLKYRAAAGEERECEVVSPTSADSLLIISDAPEPGATSSGFPVSVGEGFREFIMRADRLGVQFWWDSGFVLASFGTDRKAVAEMLRTLDPRAKKSGGLEGYMANVSPWVGRMIEIRRLVLARARAARGGDFAGAQVFAPIIEAIGPGYEAKRTVKSFSGEALIISTRDPQEGDLYCGCEDCLIVLEDEQGTGSSSRSFPAAPQSETAPRSWLRRALGN